MYNSLKDLFPDFSFNKFDISSYDYSDLLKPTSNQKNVKVITIEQLFKKFKININCNKNILKLEFLNNFTDYNLNKYGRHRIYGEDDTAVYELLLDENDKHNFLEYHVTRLDHGPSLIFIYNSKGELILMT